MRGRVWLAVVCILAVIALPSCARFRPMMHSDEAVGTRAARHNLPDNESGIEVRSAKAIVQTDFESGTDESDRNVPPVPDDRFHESGERRQSVDEKNRFVDDASASLEPASPSSYTLVELEQIAFENNPTIAQSQANVGAAGRHCRPASPLILPSATWVRRLALAERRGNKEPSSNRNSCGETNLA
jgi:hypothetical protein